MRPLSHGWRAVDPPLRPVLFVNLRSGGGKAARARLVDRARERGIDARVLERRDDVAALAADAVANGADALGVAGGDGSLALVAAVAQAHRLPFVCLPAGTRNHFALDLGVDRDDLVGALDAFGEHGVSERSTWRRRTAASFSTTSRSASTAKPSSRLPTATRRYGHCSKPPRRCSGRVGHARGLRLVDDLGREHRDPAVVLVSNNPYALDRPVAPGTRPRLDGGELGIVVLDRPRPSADPPARAWSAAHLAADAAGPVHAGVDGEAVELDAPLAFVIRPGVLRVRMSARHPGVSPSGRLP
jgi:Diacylglycerol kinase catalytic domain